MTVGWFGNAPSTYAWDYAELRRMLRTQEEVDRTHRRLWLQRIMWMVRARVRCSGPFTCAHECLGLGYCVQYYGGPGPAGKKT